VLSGWSSIVHIVRTIHQEFIVTIRNVGPGPVAASPITTITFVRLVVIKSAFEFCRLRRCPPECRVVFRDHRLVSWERNLWSSGI
jgi:hypothetical protein